VMVMRVWLSILFFLISLSAYSQETATPTPASTPAPSATPAKLSMGGKFGIGLSYTNGDYPGAMIRYWVSDQTALDAFTASFPQDDIYDFGLGLKTNLTHPTRDLMIQGLFRASYTHTAYLPFWNPNDSYDLAAGLGFEVFMPFCDWLSVEDSVMIDFSWRPTPYGQVWGIFSPDGEAVLNPMSLSIHAYF
jgi:hypothetical protein